MNRLTKGRAIVGKITADEVNTATVSQIGTAADLTLTPDQLMCNIIFLTGTPSGPFNVIFNVAYTNFYVVVNKSGQTATLKNAGGLSCTVADTAVLFCQNSGVDMIAAAGAAAGSQVLTTGAQNITGIKTMTSPILITAPKVTDDSTLYIGTTIATAATNITAKYDATTTGIGLKTCGDVSVPQVLKTNPGADIICDTVNILHSAGAGDCANLYGRYTKVAISGNGDADTTLVGSAPRAYVDAIGGAPGTTVAKEIYGSQPWVKKNGTGTITAMSGLSALVNVGAGNFIASTINAGHFHIDGGATVTGQYDGVMIEAYPAVRSMDSLLSLVTDAGAVTAAMIRTTGDAPSLLNIAAANTFTVIGAGGMVHEAQSSASAGYLVIKVAGTAYQIPLFASV